MAKKKAIFVAATGQHVGKTTVCLGLVSGLKKRCSTVGFIKPVGQSSVRISQDIHVDKDVMLFEGENEDKESYHNMSPVLFPKGLTRDFLDGKIDENKLLAEVSKCFALLEGSHDFTVVEGTGHSSVGSIVNLSNARVAAELDVEVILVATGGLGSSFDLLNLNKALFDKFNVKIRGIVLNKVIESKREMILNYFPKALKRWDIPLLGCIPYNQLLSTPSMQDLCYLFGADFLSGFEHRFRHFEEFRMAATSLEVYMRLITPHQLTITSATREEIIAATIKKNEIYRQHNDGEHLGGGMVLTGEIAPRDGVIKQLREADIPALYTTANNFEVMQKLASHTAKIRKEDTLKVRTATEVVEEYVNFDQILEG